VLGSNDRNGSWMEICTFEGDTSDHQVLMGEPQKPWPNTRFIRVQTDRSPSSVAWFEVKVFARE
jgi:hypothetical protein